MAVNRVPIQTRQCETAVQGGPDYGLWSEKDKSPSEEWPTPCASTVTPQAFSAETVTRSIRITKRYCASSLDVRSSSARVPWGPEEADCC